MKNGALAYMLARSHSFVAFQAWRSLGQSAVATSAIAVGGCLGAPALLGPLPGLWRSLPYGAIVISGAVVLNTLWLLAIGLLALWPGRVTLFQWIFQKLVFVLGGSSSRSTCSPTGGNARPSCCRSPFRRTGLPRS